MDTLHYIFLGLAYFAAVGFLVFGLDDLFVDLQFLRYLRKRDGRETVSLETLKNEPEQLIAVFIPAWQEGGVIDRMAEFATKVLAYDRYDIFIGVYPNDTETMRCVEALSRKFPRVHMAMTRSPGPTSKADCLNAIYRAMRAREIPGQREYQLIALHDAEDVLHPLTLKVYNYHVPRRFDMGQLPVFPLEMTPWKYWVGNTYVDEFTELHLKDMYAREEMGGVVPSAGVGTAFSRTAIEYLAGKNGGSPFKVGQLAEDYMVGLELCRSGYRAGFIDYPVQREVVRRRADGRETRKTITELVAVREHFPHKFFQSVKQKARWIIGTAFQGWEQGGWWGSPAIRYTLVRDRKAPLVHGINLAGYCVVGYVLFGFGLSFTPWHQSIFVRPLFEADGLLWRIVLLDLGLLTYRVVQKVSFVSRIYGWRHALYAIPRYPVGNFVNMVATFRAARLYLGHRLLGKELAWTKTTHDFPGAEALREFERSIEDLVVEEGYATREQLEDAVRRNKELSAPEALLRLNLIDEEQYTGLWKKFSGLDERAVTIEDVSDAVFASWTEDLALRYRAMPCTPREGEGTGFAFQEPPADQAVGEIEALAGSRITPHLARPGNISYLRNRVYPDRAALVRRTDPLRALLQELKPEEARRVREFQALQNRSLADAMVALGFTEPTAARALVAASAGAAPTELATQEIDENLVKNIGPLFCDVHGIVPLRTGALAVVSMPHSESISMLRDKLGTNPELVADLPEAFFDLWRRMRSLRLAETALTDYLGEQGRLATGTMARIKEMQRLVSDPADRLMVQLGMATRESVHEALVATSGLRVWPEGSHATARPRGIEALLAPGFAEKSGLRVVEAAEGRVGFGLRGLPASEELLEVFQRCSGAMLRFRLEEEAT